MKAIILSAGRGSRLLPLTDDRPKCLLPAGARTVLGNQVATLSDAGVRDFVIVTGFLPHLVEAEVAHLNEDIFGGEQRIRTLFNPFYKIADNLASCWMARGEMQEDFIVLNGDTLFEVEIAKRVLAGPKSNAVQVTVDIKDDYDSDDMKVSLEGERLTAIGKTLLSTESDAESIGMLRFCGEGRALFTNQLEDMMRTPEGVESWYLKAIHALAKGGAVINTCSIKGMKWAELDTPEDFENVTNLFGGAD